MEYPLDKIHHFKDARLASYMSEGERPGRRLGAVLHKGNKKLAFGCNSFTKSHTIQNQGMKPFLHAEISVLLKRRHYEDLTTCSITVYRETNDGRPALAMPCSQCQKILRLFGIKKVYFSMPVAPYFNILKL
jgi:deoxycytidylate deaminase